MGLRQYPTLLERLWREKTERGRDGRKKNRSKVGSRELGKKISKQKESCGNGSRERGVFLLNIEEGWRSNNIDKGKRKKRIQR